MKKCCINISRYFLLILFLGFFGSNTFFNHTHIVDGIIIVHSHPFKSDKNGFPTHSHTTNGYILIHLLVHFTSILISSLIAIDIFLNQIVKVPLKFYDRFLIQSYPVCHPLRGPPADMLI